MSEQTELSPLTSRQRHKGTGDMRPMGMFRNAEVRALVEEVRRHHLACS